MKKMMMIALTVLASAAFASTSHVNYPKYDGMGVDNLCDAGKVFQSINPVQVCDSWTEIKPINPEMGPSDWKCTAAHMENVTVSKTGTDCVKYDTSEQNGGTCLEMGTVQRSNTVLAEKIVDMGEYQESQYFQFTIPACGK